MSCYYPLSFIAADSSLCKKAQPGAEPFCGSVECSCPTEHYTCPQDSVFIETRTTPCCVTYSCQCPNISCPYLMECGHGVQPIPNYYGGRYPGRCCTEYSFEGILCYLIFLFYLIIFVFKNLYIFFFLNVLFLFVDVDECHDSNVKTCSDICINERPFFSCACPSGKTLANDGRTCGGSNSYSSTLMIAIAILEHIILIIMWVCMSSCVRLRFIFIIHFVVCYHDGLQYLYGDSVKIGCNWW